MDLSIYWFILNLQQVAIRSLCVTSTLFLFFFCLFFFFKDSSNFVSEIRGFQYCHCCGVGLFLSHAKCLHAKLIVKFCFLGKVWTCAKFLLRVGEAGRSPVWWVGWWWGGWAHAKAPLHQLCVDPGVVVLHSSDHHDLWSLVNWQSGSWVATITLADRLRGDRETAGYNTVTWRRR